MVQHRTGVGDGELDHVRAVVVVLVHGGGRLLHQTEEISEGVRREEKRERRGHESRGEEIAPHWSWRQPKP